MAFDVLPVEIADAILIEAVKARGLKRALRLRLINRAWDAAMLRAIFKSGVVDTHFSYVMRTTEFFQKYVLYKTMHTKPVNVRMLAIRDATEFVLQHRGSSDSEDELARSVSEIFRWHLRRDSMHMCTRPPGCERCNVLKQWDLSLAVLAIAAYTNDTTLAKEVLPKVAGGDDLLYSRIPERYYGPEPALGRPLEVAAMKGNVEMTRLILEHLRGAMEADVEKRRDAYDSILQHAAKGNQIGTIEIGLEYAESTWRLLEALKGTTSLDIFKYLLKFGEGHRMNPCIHYRKLFKCAAVNGNLPVTRYLFEECGLSKDSRRRISAGVRGNLIHKVAELGHYDVVAYLLEVGVIISRDTIVAAARHGSQRLVRLLLEKNTWWTIHLKDALLLALQRENDSVVRLLMEHGVSLD